MAKKTYKIRRFQNGKNAAGDPFINYSLTIPSEIAQKLPGDMLFNCELTDKGILFTPATPGEDDIELPAWVQNGAQGATGATETAPEGKKKPEPAPEPEKPKQSARKKPAAKSNGNGKSTARKRPGAAAKAKHEAEKKTAARKRPGS